MTDPSASPDDGVIWQGSPEELDAWKKYKQRKALAFVERGYSVAWYPDGDNWMDVYLPERHHARSPELRAGIKFFGKPSQHGIEGGMVSKLTIQRRSTNLLAQVLGRPHELVDTLFNYDRGPDVNKLFLDAQARRLYDEVLEELN